ncbi:class I SAM-dependent methyltransferase [Pararhodospirillum oryzae]|uniref:Ubiquinone/menaquinone biosynthesis methyltransferase n=1 Tax=Pararhodospirillum oryzae TaxID=478448 RepID=A0A512H6Y4_9PROT|nr:class I SAM-dependent methyltransferase [Pararhodospirillum oryzae]GEO81213.1 ubiquinone/menaquinone biosynthesis methyltransferase [Pararhodospirillum oryzae]
MLPRRKNTDVLMDWVPMAGHTIVDAGCGDGALARLMARNGARVVVGLEVSERQLARALAHAPEPGVVLLKAGAEAMPLADESADAVIFFNSLHHVPPPLMRRALAEAARVARTGAPVLVSEPIADGPHFELLRGLDDETTVRAQAHAAAHDTAAHGLALVREEEYLHTVRHESFEAMRQRIAAANPERDALIAEDEPALREAFERLSAPAPDGGRTFDQPMRATLLRKTAL